MSQNSRSSKGFRFSRRNLLAAVAGLPALSGSSAEAARKAVDAAPKAFAEDSIYNRLFGLRPYLSCRGHTTIYGGSRMPPEVLRAMVEANDYFVDMHELNLAAGRRIAEVMGAEAALVTAGSFSAMILGAAACLTGTDPARVDALPHPTWPKQECLIPEGHRFSYDRAYRAAGVRIVDAPGRDLAGAINERTAMIAVLASVERSQERRPEVLLPEEAVQIGRRAGVPVLIDAASELPPIDSLTRYVGLGADLVVISGGKGIEGPQSTGILAGRKDLIEAATLNHSPNTGIGRGMKVGKEEIVGLVVALDRYISLDHTAVQLNWNRKAQYMSDQLQGVPGLKAEYRINAHGFGEVALSWDRGKIPLTGQEAAEQLRQGEPRVIYYENDEGGTLQTRAMKDGEEIFAARRLREFFLQAARG